MISVKTDHQVASLMVLPTPVPAPRVTLPPHLLNTTKNHATVARKFLDPVTGCAESDTLLAAEDKTLWLKSLANEIGRCSIKFCKFCIPHKEISGNNTVFFIKPSQVPPGCKETYCNFAFTMCPNKTEVYRVRMAVGSDKLDAYQDIWSLAVIAKIHINSTISDAHGRQVLHRRHQRPFFFSPPCFHIL